MTIRPVDKLPRKRTARWEGVVVTGLTEDGGAAEAGLREGDVILSVDGGETPTLPCWSGSTATTRERPT